MAEVRPENYLCYYDPNGGRTCKCFAGLDYALRHWEMLQQLGHETGYLFDGACAERPIDYRECPDMADYVLIDPRLGTWDYVSRADGARRQREKPWLLGFQMRDSQIDAGE